MALSISMIPELSPTQGQSECLLFSPKRPFANGDLDSVRAEAFGHKQIVPRYKRKFTLLLE